MKAEIVAGNLPEEPHFSQQEFPGFGGLEGKKRFVQPKSVVGEKTPENVIPVDEQVLIGTVQEDKDDRNALYVSGIAPKKRVAHHA